MGSSVLSAIEKKRATLLAFHDGAQTALKDARTILMAAPTIHSPFISVDESPDEKATLTLTPYWTDVHAKTVAGIATSAEVCQNIIRLPFSPVIHREAGWAGEASTLSMHYDVKPTPKAAAKQGYRYALNFLDRSSQQLRDEIIAYFDDKPVVSENSLLFNIVAKSAVRIACEFAATVTSGLRFSQCPAKVDRALKAWDENPLSQDSPPLSASQLKQQIRQISRLDRL